MAFDLYDTLCRQISAYEDAGHDAVLGLLIDTRTGLEAEFIEALALRLRDLRAGAAEPSGVAVEMARWSPSFVTWARPSMAEVVRLAGGKGARLPADLSVTPEAILSGSIAAEAELSTLAA